MPRVRAALSGAMQTRGEFAVRLESLAPTGPAPVELVDVALVGADEITATVPLATPPGRYAVVLVDPYGRDVRTPNPVTYVACEDANDDGVCDAPTCVDANHDGLCDDPNCVDLNGDGVCDPPCQDLNHDGTCDTPTCVDADGDGYFVGCASYDAVHPGPDCDDNDPDNWASCGTCVDADGDGYFVGCDRYTVHPGPDCDDSDPDNWVSCSTCVDADGDGYFVGCDRYTVHPGPDCDDSPTGCGALCYPGNNETGALCTDGWDNDCDGAIDAADPGCGVANTPPLPQIHVVPGAGTTLTSFAADASGTVDAQQAASALSYAWDWQNDGIVDDTGPTATHTYTAAGTYTVVLSVQDGGGLTAYATFVVVVTDSSDLLTVTTAADESDAGATPASPGGSGFSLREAITYANNTAGVQTILVPAGTVIALGGTMTPFSGSDSLNLVADGAVIDGSGLATNQACLAFTSTNNIIAGLEIRNCPGWAIQSANGSNNQFTRCYVHDNVKSVYMDGANGIFGPANEVAFHPDFGLQIAAADSIIRNRFHDNGGAAIVLNGIAAAGTLIEGNTMYANAMGISLGANSDNCLIYNNTIDGNSGYGLVAPNSANGLDVRNNIFSGNSGWGVDAGDGNFSLFDHNDFFQNTSGACSSCTTLGAGSLTANPTYIDATAADFRLLATSPLVDAGTDVGIDCNGAAPGTYNGAAPDMGAWETP